MEKNSRTPHKEDLTKPMAGGITDMTDKQKFRHFKTTTYFDNGEPDRSYWYSAKNGRAMQFGFCFGHPEYDIAPYAFDLGRHSPVPMHEGEKLFTDCCPALGGPCYYDGTSLGAEDAAQVVGIYHEVNDQAIFSFLDSKWEIWFAGHEGTEEEKTDD